MRAPRVAAFTLLAAHHGSPAIAPSRTRVKQHRWTIDVAGAASMDHRCCFSGSPGSPGLRLEVTDEAGADDGAPEADHPVTIN